MAASLTQTGHIRKRPYQPSITSYFSNRQNGTASFPIDNTRSPISPPLPAETQSSLLSVGMRVRKAVPEGYKTHKTVQGYAFASITQPQKNSSNEPARELTPLCGLHKTGGWGAQEILSSSTPASTERSYGEEDDVPSLCASQSTLSTVEGSFGSFDSGNATNSRKRAYKDEVEDDMDALFDSFETGTMTLRSDRPIAKVKSKSNAADGVGAVHFSIAGDWEEASFLSPVDGMDIDSG